MPHWLPITSNNQFLKTKGEIKKLIALLLALIMVLSLAACGGGGEASNDPSKETNAPKATEGSKETEAPTDPEPVGELVETTRWSMRYDPEIWAWEDEDALDDGDYRSMFTLIIPDPENEDDELVWFRVAAMEIDRNNFRSHLRRDGFDQYEYAVNNAYETVNVGGLDFLLDDSDDEYHLYFTRIVSAGVDVEIEISGDTSHQAIADVIATLNSTIADGDGLGSVTFATSTDNGFLVVDGNMREILLYTKDGTFIGKCKLNDLCGTGYPWPCDATVTEDGSILVIMVDERQDQSADELIAFKLSGF